MTGSRVKASTSVGMAQPAMLSGEISQSPTSLEFNIALNQNFLNALNQWRDMIPNTPRWE
jgi:hypothetical protein